MKTRKEVVNLITFCPKFVDSFTNKMFPGLRKTQRKNLSLTSYGMILAQSGKMSEIARKVPGAYKHKHRLKRLWRFVNNYKVKPEILWGQWVAWCIEKFTTGKYIPVAIDWTTLPDNIQCLLAAIPFKGRAPYLWCGISACTLISKTLKNKKEERLVSRLVNLIPKDKRIILIADRGFGRASFISNLKMKDVLFVVRVKSKV